MKDCTGEIIFACGRRYTEVPQKAIKNAPLGEKFIVYSNEDFNNHPKSETVKATCFSCPCKRKAKRKEEKFYRKVDIDPKTDEAIHSPTGVYIVCAITALKDSVK